MMDLPLRPKSNATQIAHPHTSNSEAHLLSPTEQEAQRTEYTATSRAKPKSKSKSTSNRISKPTPDLNRGRLPTVMLSGFFVNRNFLEHKHLEGTYSFSETIRHPPGCECEMDECNGRMQSWDFSALGKETGEHTKPSTRGKPVDILRSMGMSFPPLPSGGVSRNVGVPLSASLGVGLARQRFVSLAQPPADPSTLRGPLLQPLPQASHRRLAIDSPGAEDLLRHQLAAVTPRRSRNDRYVSSRGRSRSPQRILSAYRQSTLSGYMKMSHRPSAPSPDGRMRDGGLVALPTTQQGRHQAFPELTTSEDITASWRRDQERMALEFDALKRRFAGRGLGFERPLSESDRGNGERTRAQGKRPPDEAVSGMGDRLPGGPGEEDPVSQGEQG